MAQHSLSEGKIDIKTINVDPLAFNRGSDPKLDKNPLVLVNGHCGLQGIRFEMEDRVIIQNKIVLASTKLNGITPEVSFYAVLDGHGGTFAAEYAEIHLLKNLVAALEDGLPVITAFQFAFLKTDEDLLKLCEENMCGTTVVSCLIEHATKKIWCANVGDSRCILARNDVPCPLSMDHKPNRSDERERVRNAGGHISFNNYVNGRVAVTRALGDRLVKSVVIADPEITCTTITEGDHYLVLACDGLYDVMTNQEILSAIYKRMNDNKASPHPLTMYVLHMRTAVIGLDRS